MVKPVELSTASVSLAVRDTRGPVSGATVRLDGRSAVSDVSGRVSFSSVATGTYAVSVAAADSLLHRPLLQTVAVVLGGVSDTLNLQFVPSPPVFETFSVLTDSAPAANDPVRVVFRVKRTGWAELTRARIWFNYPDSLHTDSAPLEADSAFRSISHTYFASGTRTIRVEAFSASGEVAVAGRALEIGNGFRPSLKVTVLAPGVFYDSVPNAIEVVVNDTDQTGTPTVVVDWGDGQSAQVFGASRGIYPHTYRLADTVTLGTFVLRVTGRDTDGLEAVFQRSLTVSRIARLVVAPQIVFTPNDTIDPSLDSIAIRLTVVSTPGFIDEIVWDINRFSTNPAHVIHLTQTFNSTSGAVATGGRDFEARFPTAALPHENEIRIRVRDSYGQTREPRLFFYITGR